MLLVDVSDCKGSWEDYVLRSVVSFELEALKSLEFVTDCTFLYRIELNRVDHLRKKETQRSEALLYRYSGQDNDAVV